jgi:hypothetical protein
MIIKLLGFWMTVGCIVGLLWGKFVRAGQGPDIDGAQMAHNQMEDELAEQESGYRSGKGE